MPVSWHATWQSPGTSAGIAGQKNLESLIREAAMSRTRTARIALLAVLALIVTIAATGARGSDVSPVYETRTPSGNGIGKFYMGREIANVMSHRRMSRLDRPGREEEERTDLLVAALPVEEDDAVADIGAGTGYFSFRVAERVPHGVVYAVDIQQEMLDEIERRKRSRGIDNIETLLGRIDDPGLGEKSADLIFIVDAYHEFSHPREMGEAIYRALRPGGHLIVVEDRAEVSPRSSGSLHNMTESQARKEITALGLRWLRTETFLPQQHFLVFQKPASPERKVD
jgi:ubiquinone/menaquinone biosynthesis C-methylase UbiE